MAGDRFRYLDYRRSSYPGYVCKIIVNQSFDSHQLIFHDVGSPNGIAPGYFLAQHKRQFGSNKMIYKITVFKDSIMGELPTLIFWVSDVLNINGGQASNANVHARELSKSVSMLSDTVLRPVGRFQEPRMVSTSLDRRDVLREHVALVEL